MSELFTQDLDDYQDASASSAPPAHAPEEPADHGRRAVNESFARRPVPEPPEEDTPPASRLSWAAYIADRADEAKKHWAGEMGMADVDPLMRVHPDFQMPNSHRATEHFVSHAIKAGTIQEASVAKDDKPTVRDPKKAKAAMEDLFRRAPKRIRAAVDAYFAEKERAMRVKLGMDDVDDGAQAEPAEAGAREPGSDDEPT